MGNIAYGGKNIYGFDIGILMLDSTFPRIRGDIGNASTWEFPVLYKKVDGGTPKKVVRELSMDDIEPFVRAARELETDGVKAIATSCGFLALFQEELAGAVGIPVFTSALLLLPMISRTIGPQKKVGVLTASKKMLTPAHFKAVGAEGVPRVVIGLEEKRTFTNFTIENWEKVDIDICRQELVESAMELTKPSNEVGAILLECTNMPPFSRDIQLATGLPVFDIVSLINMIYEAVKIKPGI